MQVWCWGWEMAWELSWPWLALGKWGGPWKETEPGVGGKCPWGLRGSPGRGCPCEERQQSEGG